MADQREICHECGFQRGAHDGKGGGPCGAFMDCEFCGCRRARFVGQLEDLLVDEDGRIWKLLLADDFSPIAWIHIPMDSWARRQKATEKAKEAL